MKNKKETTCPNCGSAIPEDAPGELCPACLLKVGTTPPKEDGADGNPAITALIASNGESGTLSADTDFAEWIFDFPEQTRMDYPLLTAGSYDCTLAKLEETIDGKTTLTGVLKLELVLIER